MTQDSGSPDAGTHESLPVVVGVNGSESSGGAARWAAHLARAHQTSLHLVYSQAEPADLDRCAVATTILDTAAQAVVREFPDVAVDTEEVSEPADVALIRRSRHARLVVVGSEDVGRSAALLLGSTTLTAATRSDCPVVAWRNVATPTTAEVVVGVALGGADDAALGAAFEYAHDFGAPVTAVHAWNPRLPADSVEVPYLIDWDALQRSETEALCAALRPWSVRFPEVDVHCVVERAKPSQLLLDHAADCQLLVVATHRSNALAATLLGSTALNLLHHSPVPVLICPAAKRF
ncbi:hypothetical protein BVC93_25040 [Mycobacterium sp. MS1601]|uniref:universal stress protein n=1 Tax=Mycobacterium sp. MS1601 TaxID=1936029 RepID=UPI0009792D56|nr:universal stress protein [Mycobacterium sp. MS1601]AQA05125.1 hypothetical protein BVC93_25040 [Mycobacterium sp. MS1601]